MEPIRSAQHRSRAYSAQIERGSPISTKESKVEMIRQAPHGSRERRSGEVEACMGYQRSVLSGLVSYYYSGKDEE